MIEATFYMADIEFQNTGVTGDVSTTGHYGIEKRKDRTRGF